MYALTLVNAIGLNPWLKAIDLIIWY